MKRETGHRWAVLCAAMVAMAWGAAEAASLPPGYTELAWIQSTGTQYIDTGVNAGSTTTVDMAFGHCVYAQGATFFGKNIWDPKGWLFIQQNNKFRFFGATGSEPGAAWNLIDKDATGQGDYRFTLGADNTARVFDAGGTQLCALVTDRTGNSNHSLWIFKCDHKSSSYGQFRLYSMKLGLDDGTELRDFVPCRNPEGVAGLYDQVEGKFYNNNGTGVFLGSDDAQGLYLNYIQSTGTQHINTGVEAGSETTIDLRYGHVTYANNGTIFGQDRWDPYGFLYIVQNNKIRFFGQTGSESTANRDWNFMDADQTASVDYRIVFNADDTANLYLNGAETPTVTRNIVRTSLATDKHLFLFWCQNHGSKGKFRLYSMKIGTNAGETLRDYVPYRESDGRIGLLDRANNNTFYPNNGTGTFGWTLAYEPNGTTCCVHEGTLTDAEVAGWTAIEKTSGKKVTATAVTQYPALTLAQGKFDLQDGTPTARTITGALKFKGGAVLSIDFTNDGCDSFTAGSVDLSEASAEHPVLVQLRKGEVVDLTHTYMLIASGVTEGDAAKFVTDDPNLVCLVEDGALMIGFNDPTLPVRATWKGTGTDPLNLADPANWTCFNSRGEEIPSVPMAETQVVLPADCSFTCTNGASFVCKELVLPSTLAGDCDLRGVKAPLLGTLNLKGHKLYLSQLAGSATITDGDEKYEYLEYIEGNGLPYINTGVQAGSDTTLDMRFGHVKYTPGTEMSIFGQNRHDPNGFLFIFQANKIRFFGQAGNESYWNFTDADLTGERDYRLVFHPDSTASLYVDNEENPTVDRKPIDRSSVAGDKRLYLFFQNTSYGTVGGPGYRGRYRLYSMKIGTNAGETVRDFVPVRRLSDGEVGLLDRAHGDPNHDEFYGHAVIWDGGRSQDVFHAGPVVPPVRTPGEVHLEVAADTEVVNSSVTLTGALKLVKEGAGTFVPAVRTGFSGGFDVLAGTVRAGIYGSYYGYGAPSTEIFVGTNAVFDVAGQGEFTPYTFVLAKSTLRNAGAAVGVSVAQLVDVRLVDDARFEFNADYGFITWNYIPPATVDLGGHELEVALANNASFWLINTQMRNGTLKVTGTGYFHVPTSQPKFDSAFKDVTLDISSRTCVRQNMTTLNYTADIAGSNGNDVKNVIVSGCFTPKGDYSNVLLQNGATIDVSQRSGPAPIQSLGKLSFADGATIYVDVGRRAVAGDEPVISWTDETKPANLDGLDFQPPPGARYCVIKGTTGVFVQKGMLILVR